MLDGYDRFDHFVDFAPDEIADSVPDSEIKLLSASVLRGCNIHHSVSVIRQEVDLGDRAGCFSGQLGTDFANQFIDRFVGLKRHRSEEHQPTGFLDQLKSPEGAPIAEVLLRAILAVETSMAFANRRSDEIGFAKILPNISSERIFLVWSCADPKISRRAAAVGLMGLRALLSEGPRAKSGTADDEFERAYRSLWKHVWQQRAAYNDLIMLQAADRKGIPWERFGGKYIRLGQGRFQRHLYQSLPDTTTFIGRRFTDDKQNTIRLLADRRLPVPRQEKVSTIKQALKAAKNIGYPVVVKPLIGSQGKGVAVDLKGPDEIASAFKRANRKGYGVLIESFVEGRDHRLLVVGGRLIAALNRVPPFVTGDAKKTIGDLLRDLNSDPRRDGLRMKTIELDEELDRLLDRAGYGLHTILPADEIFILRSMANWSTGGNTIDVTDRVHEDNRKAAIRAAEITGLTVAGIDFLTPDIGRSYKDVGGGIIEVNARPGFRPHICPGEGKPRDAAGAVIREMFPDGENGRVSVALVTGGRRGHSVVRRLDHILRSTGMAIALVAKKGAFVNGEPANPDGMRPWEATRSVLADSRIEALLSTVSPKGIVKRGLIHETCDAAAIVDIADDANMEDVRQGLEVMVRATTGKLVVGAHKSLLEAIDVADCGAAAMSAHENDGHVIKLIEDNSTVLSIPVSAIPELAQKPSRRRLEAYLFAVALAHALGCPGDRILSSLRNIRPEMQTDSPGVQEWVKRAS